MSKKHVFVVYAGPSESGRVFHALIHSVQAHARGDMVELYFAAEGTYWPGKLANASHPMHSLFELASLNGIVRGACKNCAVAFGNEASASASCGLVQGPAHSNGQIDILGFEDAGWRVWLF